MKKILSGNEAAARGAWEAGAMVGAGYPGTPSTEILENFVKYPGVYAEWSANEKVAADIAIGAAYASKRAFVTMKHVGLNVASDSFMAVSMTGTEAGLVFISADDPAMHSSQNEQDNRNYAKFARVPCLEPNDSQQAKDMMANAFTISEEFDTPVIYRMTTRICHSSGVVELSDDIDAIYEHRPQRASVKFPRNPAKYVMIPGNAVKRRPLLEQRIQKLAAYAETSPLNYIEKGSSALGIITSGISYQYAKEVFPDASILHLGITWPLPKNLIHNFAQSVQRLIVLEELDPFIEEAVKIMGIQVEGKDIFPAIGEYNPRIIRESAVQAGLLPPEAHISLPPAYPEPIPARPPVLCAGCPHRSSFYLLHKMKVPVTGDIGCYSLGVIEPLSAIHTLGSMGDGIAVAQGAVKSGSTEKYVAVIGDSTFFHSGIPALANAVYNQTPFVTIIMDNRITGMTGHQDNLGTGKTLQGKTAPIIDIEALVRAMGVQHVTTLPSFEVDKIETTLKDYLKLDEPSVLITLEPCALLPDSRKRWEPLYINAEACNGCTLCFRVGCPAILKSEELDEHTQRPKAIIDPTLCTGCEVCSQICPRDAISFRKEHQQNGITIQ